MKNADMPAMPCELKDFDSLGVQVVRESYEGLTKREMFAIHAMQGLLTAHEPDGTWAHDSCIAAITAVEYADALLAELEKTNAN